MGAKRSAGDRELTQKLPHGGYDALGRSALGRSLQSFLHEWLGRQRPRARRIDYTSYGRHGSCVESRDQARILR